MDDLAPGTVRLVSIAKRTTKTGQPFWMVTDHRGQKSKIWSRFEDAGAEVEGARLADVVDAVVASGEAVTVKTRDTKWGSDLLAVHRQLDHVPSEDEPDPALERNSSTGKSWTTGRSSMTRIFPSSSEA